MPPTESEIIMKSHTKSNILATRNFTDKMQTLPPKESDERASEIAQSSKKLISSKSLCQKNYQSAEEGIQKGQPLIKSCNEVRLKKEEEVDFQNTPGAEESLTNSDRKEKNICKKFCSYWKTALNTTYVTHPLIIMFCCVNLFGGLSQYVPYVYVPNMMALDFIRKELCSSIVTVIGVANVIGRIGSGFLADLSFVSSVEVVSVSMFIAGGCLFAFPFASEYYEYFM